MKKSDILAVLDDLNQYLNGYVTNEGLKESLTKLLNKLKRQSVDNNIN